MRVFIINFLMVIGPRFPNVSFNIEDLGLAGHDSPLAKSNHAYVGQSKCRVGRSVISFLDGRSRAHAGPPYVLRRETKIRIRRASFLPFESNASTSNVAKYAICTIVNGFVDVSLSRVLFAVTILNPMFRKRRAIYYNDPYSFFFTRNKA